jgi:hypothetical protein
MVFLSMTANLAVYRTCVKGIIPIKNGALLADFLLLFVEGCLFVLIASILPANEKFAWAIVVLLALDSIWGFLAKLAFTGADAQNAERTWALINVITIAAVILFIIFTKQTAKEQAVLFQVGLLTILSVRTIVDYYFCWEFYFPPHTEGATRRTPSSPRRRSG